MKNIPITLKKKLICYCAPVMFSNADAFYHTLIASTNLMLVNYNGEDVGTIEISPENILTMYTILGQRDEYHTSGIHSELKTALLGNLMPLTQSENADLRESATYVLTELQKRSDAVDAWVNFQIENGYQKLIS